MKITNEMASLMREQTTILRVICEASQATISVSLRLEPLSNIQGAGPSDIERAISIMTSIIMESLAPIAQVISLGANGEKSMNHYVMPLMREAVKIHPPGEFKTMTKVTLDTPAGDLIWSSDGDSFN